MSVEHLKDENFEEKLKTGKTVVDFYADWCGPCKMFAPTFEKVAGEISGVNFYKVNVDDAGAAAEKYSVMSIPTIIYLEDGVEKSRSTGAMNEESFVDSIKENLKI